MLILMAISAHTKFCFNIKRLKTLKDCNCQYLIKSKIPLTSKWTVILHITKKERKME